MHCVEKGRNEPTASLSPRTNFKESHQRPIPVFRHCLCTAFSFWAQSFRREEFEKGGGTSELLSLHQACMHFSRRLHPKAFENTFVYTSLPKHYTVFLQQIYVFLGSTGGKALRCRMSGASFMPTVYQASFNLLLFHIAPVTVPSSAKEIYNPAVAAPVKTTSGEHWQNWQGLSDLGSAQTALV